MAGLKKDQKSKKNPRRAEFEIMISTGLNEAMDL